MSTSRHEVGHFEIPADNVDGLRSFYSSLFGWEFEKGQTQGYYMIKNAGISGALAQKESPQQVSTQFVKVESIEEYINKAKQLGARVMKESTGNIRWILCSLRRSTEKCNWNMARQAIVDKR